MSMAPDAHSSVDLLETTGCHPRTDHVHLVWTTLLVLVQQRMHTGGKSCMDPNMTSTCYDKFESVRISITYSTHIPAFNTIN
jgi:hypothetical protein